MIEIPDVAAPDSFFRDWFVKNQLRADVVEAIGRLSVQIATAHDDYVRLLASWSDIEPVPLSKEDGALLRAIYEMLAPENHRSHLRDVILANPHRRHIQCSYCGAGEGRTLDHYLPQSKYPEFAVTPRNLIPCCATCNQLKGAQRGRDRFRHAYIDDDHDEPYLVCQIDFVGKTAVATYDLTRPAWMPLTMYTGLGNQFQRLRLRERFGKEFAKEFPSHKISLRNLQAIGPDAIEEWALESRDDWVETWGVNHFHSAWLAAVPDGMRRAPADFGT